MAVLNFIIDNILINAAVILGLVALLGLILQRKSVSECISGTFKTMMGFMILSSGSSVIVGALEPFSTWFSAGLGIQGSVASIEAVLAVAMQNDTIGRDIAFVYAGIFVVNLLIARFTKWKFVFLNGEAPIYMAMASILFGVGLCGFGHVPAVLIGAVLGGICCVLFPALAQPIVRKITGSDDIALGHFCTLGYLLSAGVSKLTGDVSKSTEDAKFPAKLSFLQDTYLAVGAVMVPLYVIMALLAGPEVVAEAAGDKNYIVYAILQGITFCVGLFILLTGVRLLIAELVPAFAGIAEKVVPGARPCLDCPVLFTYAPNAIVYGFVFTTVGTVIGMFLWPLFGLPMVIPGIMSNFFAGGTAAIFANATGGRRGTIIASIVHGPAACPGSAVPWPDCDRGPALSGRLHHDRLGLHLHEPVLCLAAETACRADWCLTPPSLRKGRRCKSGALSFSLQKVHCQPACARTKKPRAVGHGAFCKIAQRRQAQAWPSSFILAKHSLQYTGRSSRGLKGTRASLPHAAHVAVNISRVPRVAFLRASRQALQRWGSFSKPRLA